MFVQTRILIYIIYTFYILISSIKLL